MVPWITNSRLALSVQAKSGVCIWYDGVSRCGRYWMLAHLSMVCSMLDYAITIVFTLAGRMFEKGGARSKQCGLLSCVPALSLVPLLR